MTERRSLLLPLGALLLGLALQPAAAQEPEVIILDPSHPLIQDPRTAHPGEEPSGAEVTPSDIDIPVPGQGVDAREILADLWFRQRALAGRGSPAEAAHAVAVALEFMRREGLRAAPEIAAAFGAEAREALRDGDYRRARDNFELAARFDPSGPGPQFGLAIVLLRGERDPLAAFSAWWKGWSLSWGDPGTVCAHLGNALLLFYLGLWVGAAVTLGLLCLRSAPSLAHDLKEKTRGRLGDESSRLAAVAAMMIPLLLFLPAAWLPAIWGALFFPYFRRGERVIAAAVLALSAIAGPAGWMLEWSFRSAADPATRALMQSVRGGYDFHQEEGLRHLVADHPEEPMFPFLLAKVYRESGRFNDAMTMYRRVLEVDPGHARAMVNLGNLHALRQESAQALNFYVKAGEADAHQMLGHFNAALLHHDALHLEASEDELRAAQAIDDSEVARLLAEGKQGRSGGLPVDASYTSKEIWKRAITQGLRSGPPWRWQEALTAPGTLAGGLGLVAVILVPGIGLGSRAAGTRRCRRCGRPFCRRCQVAGKHPDHCSQCMHLFILKDGVAPTVKKAKLGEVERHARGVWIGERLLSLVLPGGGHVLGGRVVLGGALLVVWSIVWLGVGLSGRLLVAPEWLATAAGPGAVAALFCAGLVVWAIGNFSSHQRAGE
jgi:Flp pilus assembly protein TadD